MSLLKTYDEMNAEQQMAYRMGEAAAELSNDEIIGLAVQLLKAKGAIESQKLNNEWYSRDIVPNDTYLLVPLSILGDEK